MSDEGGIQLSIEDAIEDADTKSHESSVEEEREEPEKEKKTTAVRKARAANKNSTEKLLAV